jgi:hypothetical protein
VRRWRLEADGVGKPIEEDAGRLRVVGTRWRPSPVRSGRRRQIQVHPSPSVAAATEETEGGEGIRTTNGPTRRGPISSAILPTTGRKRWTREEDEYDIRACPVSEIIGISGQDYPFPGEPNKSRVRFRPGLQSLGYKRHGF